MDYHHTPDEMAPGSTSELTFRLMYAPEERYDGVVAGATFTLREGPLIIGFGQILTNPT